MIQINKSPLLKINYAFSKTSLGLLLLAATERGICFLQFGEDQKVLLQTLQQCYPNANLQIHSQNFDQWMHAIEIYLQSKSQLDDLPLDIHGTDFQIKVWKYLQTIPAGKTQSYQQVATGLGSPQSVRAVARACATNHIALVIPCHRVVRSDGQLAGYRWGLARKSKLLENERAYLLN